MTLHATSRASLFDTELVLFYQPGSKGERSEQIQNWAVSRLNLILYFASSIAKKHGPSILSHVERF